jgi:chromatin structure-remodeling complex protein RSC7
MQNISTVIFLLLIFSSRFNSSLGALRRNTLNGIYDPHTNVMLYPKNMQPTHARWEQIDDNEAEIKRELTNGHTADHDDEEVHSIFTPVKPIYSRNYMIVDTVYESAPASNLGVPGPDGDAYDLGFNGLSSVSEDIKAELPPECLKAFEAALEKEEQWKTRWGTESQSTHRKAPAIDKGVVIM